MKLFQSNKKQDVENTGLVALNNPNSVIAEQFKTVRTNIQFSSVDKKIKTMVVTSAAPSSGKSTIAANLAVTFSQDENNRTLLVDADLRRPTVHKTFQLQNFQGLTTLLTDEETSLADAIEKRQSENLYILTSGPIPPNPAEILASNRMEELIQEMSDYFDTIIFDMPPILAVTDAQLMTSKVDGTIFVVPKDMANKDEVYQAAEQLKNVKANVLGTILNRVESSSESYYYYYGN